MSLVEDKMTFLDEQGFASAYPEAWRNWLISEVGYRASTPELEKAYLEDKGFSGSVPQMWLSLYQSLGFNSAASFWEDAAKAAGFLFKYDFKQTDLAKAVKEQVKGQSTLTQINAANRHIIQSDGIVQTFAPNEPAFRVGEGVVSQGEATNFYGDSALVNSYEGSSVGADTPATGLNWLDGFINTGRVFPQGNSEAYGYGNIPANPDGKYYTFSAFVEMHDGMPPKFQSNSPNSPDNDFTITVLSTSVNPLTYEVTAQSGNVYRVSATSNLVRTSASMGGIYRRPTNSGKGFTVSGYQIEEGSVATSPIITAGSPATRPADVTTISTFVEKGVWLDGGVAVGGYSNQGWDRGVNFDSVSITYIRGLGDDGKYLNYVEPKWIGATLVSQSGLSRAVVTAIRGNNGANLRMLTGNLSEFQYPNPHTIDFTTSDYWTGDFAADTATLEALRTAAGDDVSQIAQAELMPSNDFVHEHTAIMQGNAADHPAITNIAAITKGGITSRYYVDPANPTQVSYTLDGTADPIVTVTLPDAILANDVLKIKIEKSSVDGTTLTVNGVTATQGTATSNIEMDRKVTLGNGFIHQSLNDKEL